jgi:hypothetical protein
MASDAIQQTTKSWQINYFLTITKAMSL